MATLAGIVSHPSAVQAHSAGAGVGWRGRVKGFGIEIEQIVQPALFTIAVMIDSVAIGFVMGTPDVIDRGREVGHMEGGGVLFLWWTQEEIADKVKELWPEGGIHQTVVGDILREKTNFVLSLKNDFASNASLSTLSKRYELPEIVLMALAFDGKSALSPCEVCLCHHC
jgi:hypothetical protein